MRSSSWPARPTKGLPLQILVAAGRFADQHEAGVLASPREAEALGRALERATVERCDQGLELGKGGGLSHAGRVDASATSRGRCGRGAWPWLGAGGGGLGRGRGKAIDRRLADRLVDAHRRVPGEQRLNRCCSVAVISMPVAMPSSHHIVIARLTGQFAG